MKVTLEQLWGEDYQPWLEDSEPWNTIVFDESITTNNISPTIKYGAKILANAESVVISNITPTLKYGIKFLAESVSVAISILTPKKIGSFWEKMTKGSAVWEKYGTTLWSWRNSPWLDDYYPWQEKGGEKPETNYNNINKPIV
jgi:hypothetical protein